MKHGAHKLTSPAVAALTAALVSTALLLSACGGPSDPITPVATTQSTPTSTTLLAIPDPAVLAPVCVPGAAGWRQAPDDWYRDDPVYTLDQNDLAHEITVYAETLAGFEALWTNPERDRWIHVGFVGTDVLQRQQQLEQAFPEEGVVAVALDHTARQLTALAAELKPQLPEGMSVYSTNVRAGTIDIWVGKVTDEHRTLLGSLSDKYPLCAAGLVGEQIGEPGPQLLAGNGWRYLAEADNNLHQLIRVVTTDEDLEDLWDEIEPAARLPRIDWYKDVVVAFEIGYSGSCPDTRFEGVIAEGGQLVAVVINPTLLEGLPPATCTGDYNPRIYVVSVARDQLPPPPFVVKSGPEVEQEVIANVDLREPGTTLQP